MSDNKPIYNHSISSAQYPNIQSFFDQHVDVGTLIKDNIGHWLITSTQLVRFRLDDTIVTRSYWILDTKDNYIYYMENGHIFKVSIEDDSIIIVPYFGR